MFNAAHRVHWTLRVTCPCHTFSSKRDVQICRYSSILYAVLETHTTAQRTRRLNTLFVWGTSLTVYTALSSRNQEFHRKMAYRGRRANRAPPPAAPPLTSRAPQPPKPSPRREEVDEEEQDSWSDTSYNQQDKGWPEIEKVTDSLYFRYVNNKRITKKGDWYVNCLLCSTKI